MQSHWDFWETVQKRPQDEGCTTVATCGLKGNRWQSWRAAGISCWMPSVATTTVSAQGMWVRYQEHLPHCYTGKHLPELEEEGGRQEGSD